jgi:hypothetical protein
VIRGASNWSTTPPATGGPGLNGSFNLPFNFDFMAGTGRLRIERKAELLVESMEEGLRFRLFLRSPY